MIREIPVQAGRGRTLRDRIRGVRVFALRLLDQQLWCLGRDICATSNLLFEYGFDRRRPEDSTVAGSEYFWQDAHGSLVTVWAYGVHITRHEDAGLFIRRYGFAPRYTRPGFLPHGCWHIHEWKNTAMPRTEEQQQTACARIVELCAWFADYERWIEQTQGLPHRAQCLNNWHKEAVTTPDGVAAAWETVAKTFRE